MKQDNYKYLSLQFNMQSEKICTKNVITAINHFEDLHQKLLKNCGISKYRINLAVVGDASSDREYFLCDTNGDIVHTRIENDQKYVYTNGIDSLGYLVDKSSSEDVLSFERRVVVYVINNTSGNRVPFKMFLCNLQDDSDINPVNVKMEKKLSLDHCVLVLDNNDYTC